MLALSIGSAMIDGLRDSIAIAACVGALAGIGLNIQFGFAGLLNFGHVGSALVGAYGAAIVVNRGGPLWVGVIVGIVAAGILGLLMGLPTLRLRADYLAIATISVAEILRVVANSARMQSITGGPIGISNVADDFYAINPIPEGRYGIGSFSYNHNTLWAMIVGWTLVALASLGVWALARSPWGRLLKAIREDEEATRSLGKNVFAMKLQAFVMGSVIAGVAGIIFTFDGGFVKPDFFIAQTTFNWYLVVILGGAATVIGPTVGSIVFWFVISVFNSLLSQAIGQNGWWFIDSTDVGAVRYVFVGVAIALLLVFRPQGLFGNKDEAVIGER
ncbi:MAG: branched-chain amino acid ABC transporter permease [Microthrixaceae bacterium]|nr:branched-chain amino acid ABC transporter permease [Microthrixaceae bacterium]